jgi:hypothetical protein
MTRDQLLFWFGWHYDVLDNGFRVKHWPDRIAYQVFCPIQRIGRGEVPMNAPLAEVAYDTETMTYLWLKCNSITIRLEDWKL